MRYVDRLKVIDDNPPDSPLLLGTALHTGIEKDVETAINQYYFSFPVIGDEHITEAMKLEYQIERARELIPPGMDEVLISCKEFKGFIDRLVPVGYMSKESALNPYGQEVTMYDLYDFKYSNNEKHYLDSRQLHLYKYYFEKTNPGKKIRSLFFLFVPKNSGKRKENEDLYSFRNRLLKELEKTPPKLVEVPFNYEKVIEHHELFETALTEKEYEADESWLCRYCEYAEYCLKGKDYMILPSSERRNISSTKKRKLWIYGAAFSGKTTMLDDAPNPLNLNTDGNVQFVTMPFIPIKDEVKVEGRITKRKYAWEVFKEAISELEKGQNDFKTIIVDLLEDTREACRVYMYDQLKIQHESDSGFGKGWDIIKTEYLSTMRRFFNLDYENLIVVSHEDVSKDITKKNGQNITRIAPNIQDAVANKIAGMVDIVARVVVEDDGARTLNFKANEVVFGGGRLKGVRNTTIPLSWDALMKVYDEANNGAASEAPDEPPSRGRGRNRTVTHSEPEQNTAEPEEPTASDDKPPFDTDENPEASADPAPISEGAAEPVSEGTSTRGRRSRNTAANETANKEPEPEQSEPKEAVSEPGRRTRRART